MTSSGHLAARSAHARPIRRECHVMTFAVAASYAAVICCFSHASSLWCVYGSPSAVAKSGDAERAVPWHGRRSSRSRRAEAAL
eukprot:3024073-Pleurochrysis_carterae.AAC.1